ncbi:hypothetical protein ACVR0S_05410 [Streptococcus dentapri]|uniref:Uncharacterized protein n=1 Tax=Streptococcus dentapri TaxID=573564 RepID=A0ABV8D373_9STRE
MITSYRESKLEDIEKRMYTYLTVVRNWFILFLLLFIASLVYWFINPTNIMGAAFTLASLMPLLALGVQYVRENNIYRKDSLKILTEDLDLKKYDDILDYESQVSLKTNWDRIIIRQAELAWLRGDFKDTKDTKGTDYFIEMINPKKVRLSPKERTPLLLTYYLITFANKVFTKRDFGLQACLDDIKTLAVQNDAEADQKAYTQQIVTLMASVIGEGKAIEDFEEIKVSNKLESILRDYLLAENARLLDQKDQAKKLYKKISQEEASLYLVREAKAALKKLK